jgi:hypothetical protein
MTLYGVGTSVISQNEHPDVLFLLGSGFNADAGTAAGPISAATVEEYGYPLGEHLGRLCFDLDELPDNRSVEGLFQEAYAAKDPKPMERLADALMSADCHIPSQLITKGGNRPNCYSEFFRIFDRANFLTFNYDSLPEQFLLHQGLWNPRDGFGVKVSAPAPGWTESTSDRCVLHLHGSLYIYTSMYDDTTWWLEELPEPGYRFDPRTVLSRFKPFGGHPPDDGDEEPEKRVIAPVLEKAEGLTGEFVTAMYERAEKLVEEAKELVTIGYSFNRHDAASFDPILKAAELGGTTVVVVSPDAEEITEWLQAAYPENTFRAVPEYFSGWVDAGFP